MSVDTGKERPPVCRGRLPRPEHSGLGLGVCTDVLQAACHGRAARAEEPRGVGQIQVVPAAQSGVPIKELGKMVVLESWTGICPGRALATHRGAEVVFCTWESVKVSHRGRNKGRGVLERRLKRLCGH